MGGSLPDLRRMELPGRELVEAREIIGWHQRALVFDQLFDGQHIMGPVAVGANNR